ncbi:type IV secretory system conjugative DNA transfer family protein [Streptomyces sp. AN091965]|uniref:type IV secretory system conjugative DNA transfer family protein n=1 Tax=Streptomyces sp. AN091965 TaxID=2927803 RepID=UPI001F612BE8|nr:type IV secretory system conjugative DNA transfer family protein [Streptomyces sp. AN091965]MCI3931595.1 type IV secretory system conjugative DNA transfer family protein [Streptomyces sp. AN091965]
MARDGNRDRRQEQPGRERGVPDALLVGALAFVVGMVLLMWSATGIAGWWAHGEWPDHVTFNNTPPAVRHLVQQPHDVAGAWPATPQDQLSGYGLFWGFLIGQVMVLIVLTIFVMGTLTRFRAVRRAARRAEPTPPPQPDPPTPAPAPAPAVGNWSAQRAERVGTAPAAEQPLSAEAEPKPEPTPPALAKRPPTVPTPRTPLVLGTPETRRPLAAEAIADAESATLVITSDPTLWEETKDARAKLGPVLVYDPAHLCDTPARLHWSPTTGCEDKATATHRARALLAPIRPAAKLDTAVADTAELLLRSFLHAAAVDGRSVKHVHRWAQGTQIQDAVRVLRTHPKAAPGAAGELESALTAYAERRDMAQELTARALSCLFTLNVRESCTPNRADALSLESLVDEGGTLFVVGEAIEDPKANPGAMPLLTALASSMVERGRRLADRSPTRRLDPPLTLVLDDVAAVAPLPQLPELLAAGADQGMPTLALLRSREQGRARWPHDELIG